jgi:hypothetical protein
MWKKKVSTTLPVQAFGKIKLLQSKLRWTVVYTTMKKLEICDMLREGRLLVMKLLEMVTIHINRRHILTLQDTLWLVIPSHLPREGSDLLCLQDKLQLCQWVAFQLRLLFNQEPFLQMDMGTRIQIIHQDNLLKQLPQ